MCIDVYKTEDNTIYLNLWIEQKKNGYFEFGTVLARL